MYVLNPNIVIHFRKSQKGKKRHHLPGVAGGVKRIPNDEDLGTGNLYFIVIGYIYIYITVKAYIVYCSIFRLYTLPFPIIRNRKSFNQHPKAVSVRFGQKKNTFYYYSKVKMYSNRKYYCA